MNSLLIVFLSDLLVDICRRIFSSCWRTFTCCRYCWCLRRRIMTIGSIIRQFHCSSTWQCRCDRIVRLIFTRCRWRHLNFRWCSRCTTTTTTVSSSARFRWCCCAATTVVAAAAAAGFNFDFCSWSFYT